MAMKLKHLLLKGIALCSLFAAIDSAQGYSVTNFNSNFSISGVYTAGGSPVSVAAFTNVNGRLDLVCANVNSNTLSVLTNNGLGSFVYNSTYAVGGGPVSVVAADVNTDSKVDLICANQTSNTVSVLTNNGNGHFVTSGTYAVGNQPYAVTAFTNVNGRMDLACANLGDNSLTILTNNGSGIYGFNAAVGVGNSPRFVIAADVNGDHKMDLVCVNQGDNSLTILTNNGSGGFVPASSPGVGSYPSSVVAADVNGDGKVDLIGANYGNNTASTLSVLTNNGSGAFTISGNYPVGGGPYQALSVAATDVNGDGKVDLITANNNSSTLSVLTNTGNGIFVLATNYSVAPNPQSVVAADVNGDGVADLIVANNANNSLTVLTHSPIVSYPLQITSFAPTSGVIGTSVIITGPYNFSTVEAVLFNGQSAAFTINSDTQITATVPSCAISGSITVINPSATVTSLNSFTYVRQPITVTTTDEPSLDYAVCNGSTVTFSVGGTIGLTSQLVISSDIILDGAGQNMTISGNNSVGIFAVNPGVHLTLKNLIIANGQVSSAGAGIYNNGGIVTAINCTFSNNNAIGSSGGATGAGGGIFNSSGGTVIITGSTFVSNSATGGIGGIGATGGYGNNQGNPGGSGYAGGIGAGGAVYNFGGNIFITNCTFYGNLAVGGTGGTGGQGCNGYTFPCNCHSCGFGSTCCNTCYYYGGPGGQGGVGGNAYGGNIYNYALGNVTVVNTTFASGSVICGSGGQPGSAGNYSSGNFGSGSSGAGAGGNIDQVSGTFLLINTIVANPVAGGNFSGVSITDGGNNLSSDATVPFTSVTSYTNTNPNLGSLTNNGGPTWTMALLPGSPVIDKGQNIPGLTSDQRGLPRLSGYAFDIGAYELQVVGIDAGLRAYDGTAIIKLAVEGPGSTNSALRFSKNGTNYGILLTATNSANASKFRIQTASGTKAFMKLP